MAFVLDGALGRIGVLVVGHRHSGQQGPARLFDDQRQHPRLHPVAGDASGRSRHPRQCGGAGPVWTPLNPADKPPEAVAKFGGDTPMQRPAQPEEIAPANVFLAAPACSSYIDFEVPRRGKIGSLAQ